MKNKILKVCVDLSNTKEKRIKNLYNAFLERDSNLLNEHSKEILKNSPNAYKALMECKECQDIAKLLDAKPKIREELLVLEMALPKSKMWKNGRTLNVKFLGGNDYLHQKVVYYAKKWEKYANLKFNFIQTGTAEIRIAFDLGNGSWSYVGTDCLIDEIKENEPTMNFGWFDENTPEIEFSRTIIHEFGHAIGCIHEHSSPEASIPWNKEVVYKYYKESQGWSKEDVDNNLFARFDATEMTNSSYDSKSIMHYPIDKSFVTDPKFAVGWNKVLSPTDIEFASICYPFL